MSTDILIQNGRIIDPARGLDAVGEIYIHNGMIAELPESGLDKENIEVFDATGLLVLPGLVDTHTHLPFRLSEYGLNPDLHLLPGGVTAAVDAGSGGTANFEGMYHTVFSRTAVHIRSYLNVTATGIITSQYCENTDPAYYDLSRMEYLLDNYGDHLLGLKLRLARKVQGEDGLRHLAGAVKIAEQFGQRLCVHVTDVPYGYEQILELLRPDDILTHCYQCCGGDTILDKDDKVRSAVWAAREKGILFDTGNGRHNHGYRVMERALHDGFFPDTISSDLLYDSANSRQLLFSLLRVMSEYLALGMSLTDVLRAVTETPAKQMRMEGRIGTLAPGAEGDIAVCRVREKATVLHDFYGGEIMCRQMLLPVMTVRKGDVAYCSMDYAF